MRRTIAIVASAGIVAAASGCALQTSDATKFRQPIPKGSDVALAIAGSQVAGTTAQAAGTVHLQNGPGAGGGGAGSGSYASLLRVHAQHHRLGRHRHDRHPRRDRRRRQPPADDD